MAVLENEIRNILKVIEDIGVEFKFNYKCKLMEIIVQKKINERFFQETNRGLTNPSSGTVILEGAVSPKFWDFYLVAQKVTQGTCTPTKYTVVYNTTDIGLSFNSSEQELADLTFTQCFNYYNWQGAIKTPACVMYASRIAYFVQTALATK